MVSLAQDNLISKLRMVVDLTSSYIGEDYFKKLSRELSKAFNVEYVIISETADNFKQIKTIANWSHDELIPNIQYHSENTPCGKLHKDAVTFYPSNLNAVFPYDMALGEMKAVSYLGMPFYDIDGEALGHVCLLGKNPMDKNIYNEYLIQIIASRLSSEVIRQKHEKKLIFMATHDDLTQLPNKVLFWDRLKTAISRADRNHSKLGLLFIDLNDFKAINDTYGHDVGDLFLIAISKIMQASCRDTDTLCRYGGDEFVVIVEGISSLSDIACAADSIYSNVIKDKLLIGDNSIQAGLSIGAAIYPEHANDPDDMLNKADEAMYQAKISGTSYKMYVD